MQLKNKVVLVTGASRGIGRAVALSFAEQGALVALNYHINLEAAEKTLRELPGGPHALFCADISLPSQVEILVKNVVERFDRLDVLVNNAGVFTAHPVQDTGYPEWLDHWQQTLNTNLLGPANLIYWAVQHMMQQGSGRIVNISSRGAFRGEPEAPAYGASKAGLNSLSQSLAQALAPHNIFITSVAPGWVETDMAEDYLSGPEGEEIRNQSPLGRVAQPEEVARIVLFLASEASIYMTGAIVDVNGASYLRS